MCDDRLPVGRGGVAFIMPPVIYRIVGMELFHEPVANHFCYDRGGCNLRKAAISPYVGLHSLEMAGGMRSVYADLDRRHRQAFYGFLHCQQGSPQNIIAVYGFRSLHAYTYQGTVIQQCVEDFQAPGG